MAKLHPQPLYVALSTGIMVPLFSRPLVATLFWLLLFIPLSAFVTQRARRKDLQNTEAEELPEITLLSQNLLSALPENVILPHQTEAFKHSKNSYWAWQETEVVPACIIRPSNDQQLCKAISILKHEYDERQKQEEVNLGGLFAIRGGGHSPLPGSASIKEGVLIDLSQLCQVTVSEDRSSVTFGGGAKWKDVTTVLDQEGLAVVGGRNSDVGVGGLTLGGGLSFFTPRFGLVCSNILSYDIVLASGSVATISATENPDLWRALKGGSNNFGIITSFTARCFPCTKIWSGFLYMPSSQAKKVLSAFYSSVRRADSNQGTDSDDHAAGPLACFTYVQPLGVQVISVNLVYTKPPENENKWPTYWRKSPFASIFRYWSSCKSRTLTNATNELASLNTPGRRQLFAATTIKNDQEAIYTAHTAYQDAITTFRTSKVKGLSWTLVLQPFLPAWVRKGYENPLGLDEGTDEPLVIVSLTVNWPNGRDDEFIKAMARRTIEKVEEFASANGLEHRYRYLNYCAEWQRPFESYGEKNSRFLTKVSKKYDPDGLFQRGCAGGHKLDLGA